MNMNSEGNMRGILVLTLSVMTTLADGCVREDTPDPRVMRVFHAAGQEQADVLRITLDGALSRDGRLLACAHHVIPASRGGGDTPTKLPRHAGTANEVYVWETATGKMLLTVGQHQKTVYDVKFSPDGGSC